MSRDVEYEVCVMDACGLSGRVGAVTQDRAAPQRHRDAAIFFHEV